jgi:hypothetical protein
MNREVLADVDASVRRCEELLAADAPVSAGTG